MGVSDERSDDSQSETCPAPSTARVITAAESVESSGFEPGRQASPGVGDNRAQLRSRYLDAHLYRPGAFERAERVREEIVEDATVVLRRHFEHRTQARCLCQCTVVDLNIVVMVAKLGPVNGSISFVFQLGGGG